MHWLVWFIAAAALAGAEIFVPGFYLGSLAVAAAAAALASAVGASTTWQLWTFVLSGSFVFVVARPLVMRYLQRPDRESLTGVAALPGTRGEVLEAIRPGLAGGRVQVGGDNWRARTTIDREIPTGTTVTVVRVSGATLEVRPVVQDSQLSE